MKILQLCGRAPSASLVPVDIPGAERWIIGACYAEHVGTAYTRVFDVHDAAYIKQQRQHAWDWYGQQDRPVYLVETTPEIPTGIAYPRARLAMFGSRGYTALSSSIDHMMALALLEGFEQIHLCGVRLLNLEEWVGQRECLAYWIGRAEGVGCHVVTDPVAALCTPEVVYGFGESTGARRAPGQPLPMEAFA